MTGQTARPIRALGVLLLAYLVGRVGLATIYTQEAITGMAPYGTPTLAAVEAVATHPVIAAVATGHAIAATVDRVAAELPAAVDDVTTRLPATLARRRYSVVVDLPPPVRFASRRPIAARQVVAMATPPGSNEVVPIQGARTPDDSAGSAEPRSMIPAAIVTAPEHVAPGVPTPRHGGSRLSGSAWALVRQQSGDRVLATGGTLGGSQIGARLAWQPLARSPLFVTVRASGALNQRETEIAPGIGVQGKGVGLIVEQRIPLESGRRSRTAVVGYGGFTSVVNGPALSVDGYGQAGAVGTSDTALFVDGALRVERAVTRKDRPWLGAGAGVWGAAQPGVARVDVGPQLVLHVPGKGRAVRLSTEYRVRVAGRARPGSGFTVTLGTDF